MPAWPSRRDSATARAEFHDLRIHAAGALGQIFTARDGGLNRDVALKCIRPERADDPDSRRRFLQEAEVTGRLDHPGVVPIYALGSDPGGAPCYAMRLVRGRTLQEAIDDFHAADRAGRDPSERSMALRDLLDRFVSICETMGYAHSRGVLHRDLKPRNVMLGMFGETLVVDWGLAKAIGPAEGPREGGLALLPADVTAGSGTPTVGTVGTLGYMSPEQGEGRWDVVGPASDIFSLGAILYAILAGRAPYQGRTVDEILQKVRRCEFRTPRQVKPGVPRPLEAICLNAMSCRPGERYATTPELAADVRRWLADEPVTAHRESFVARGRRWMRRHRAAVAVAAVVMVLGLGALAGFATILAAKNRELDRERRRAEHREALAIEAVRKFRDAVQSDGELKRRPELDGLRKVLLREPLAFFGELKRELGSERAAGTEALAKLATATRDLAITTEEIGSVPDAIRAHSESIEILRRLARERPEVADYRRELASSHRDLGRLLGRTARPAEALESYRRALEIRECLACEHPRFGDDQARLAGVHSAIGLLLQETGRPDEAMQAHRRGLEIRERLALAHPEVARYQIALAGSRNNIGLVLREMGRGPEALESYRRALEIQGRLAREHTDVAEYRSDLAGSQHNLGLLLNEMGRREDALASFRRGLEIRERLARDVPSMTEFQSDLAHSLNGTGYMLDVLGRKAEALGLHRRALEIRERLVAGDPAVTEHRSDLARSLGNIGGLLRQAGRSDEALAVFERQRAILEPLVGENPAVHSYRFALGAALDDLAAVEMDFGRWEPARGRLLEGVANLRSALAAMPENRKYLRTLRLGFGHQVRVYSALARPDEAIRAANDCAAIARGRPDELYDVACMLATGVRLAGGGTRRVLADEAVRSLERAIAAGWDDAAWTHRDPDLDPLRDREDFRRLLGKLFDRGFPVDPFGR
jgi:serine/threonine-protein kinase